MESKVNGIEWRIESELNGIELVAGKSPTAWITPTNLHDESIWMKVGWIPQSHRGWIIHLNEYTIMFGVVTKLQPNLGMVKLKMSARKYPAQNRPTRMHQSDNHNIPNQIHGP